jgi:2-oxoisovalerate dehydrogenase E1 component alpha subunit
MLIKILNQLYRNYVFLTSEYQMENNQIHTLQYLDEEGNLSSKFSGRIEKPTLIKIYETMLRTRHIDERMINLQRQGSISFAMSSLGEEGCIVASAAALEMGDWIYPQYREMGAIFWRGLTPEEYLHHMFGDSKDPSLGRQMPNHFGSRKLNVVTVSSPIGTKIPHAAGCAYAMKLQKDPHVAVCYFGEGATSEGDFHVGLNFAAVRKVPAIFFCRNNCYAISTKCSHQFATDGIAPKGAGYGIQTFRVDGNDVFAVYETVSQARKLCLEGKGPILIEAMTYRMGAHSTSDDPSAYRTEDEVAAWKKKCPLKRLRHYLEKEGLWNAEKEQEAEQKISKEVTDAIAAAKETPKPDFRTLMQDVTFERTKNLEEQLRELKLCL